QVQLNKVKKSALSPTANLNLRSPACTHIDSSLIGI
ncbi:unnamed protein product, partial [Rotaria magnacalcarata]